ncbi:MAG: hypothetical protein AAFV45_04290 [Pseudomonadota bacterium]
MSGLMLRRLARPSGCARAVYMLAIGAALCGLAGSPAIAKIKCKGPYQVVGGNLIGTPYCGDGYLAGVARTYGFKYSAREIRGSFAKKQEVCRLIGQDTRVSDFCRSTLPHYRGRGF